MTSPARSPAARSCSTPATTAATRAHRAAINRLVAIGQGVRKACDTTGTATASGYTEAAYNWDVAKRTRGVLESRGARVLLTRKDNDSVGPCIDERARIANRAHADLRVSIHADGGPPSGYGFHVIEPKLIRGLTDDIFAASHRLAVDLRDAFTRATGEPFASYIANDGLARRGDLGGLRLADVPSVFIETGNMRSARDARRLGSPRYRRASRAASRTGSSASSRSADRAAAATSSSCSASSRSSARRPGRRRARDAPSARMG